MTTTTTTASLAAPAAAAPADGPAVAVTADLAAAFAGTLGLAMRSDPATSTVPTPGATEPADETVPAETGVPATGETMTLPATVACVPETTVVAAAPAIAPEIAAATPEVAPEIAAEVVADGAFPVTPETLPDGGPELAPELAPEVASAPAGATGTGDPEVDLLGAEFVAGSGPVRGEHRAMPAHRTDEPLPTRTPPASVRAGVALATTPAIDRAASGVPAAIAAASAAATPASTSEPDPTTGAPVEAADAPVVFMPAPGDPLVPTGEPAAAASTVAVDGSAPVPAPQGAMHVDGREVPGSADPTRSDRPTAAAAVAAPETARPPASPVAPDAAPATSPEVSTPSATSNLGAGSTAVAAMTPAASDVQAAEAPRSTVEPGTDGRAHLATDAAVPVSAPEGPRTPPPVAAPAASAAASTASVASVSDHREVPLPAHDPPTDRPASTDALGAATNSSVHRADVPAPATSPADVTRTTGTVSPRTVDRVLEAVRALESGPPPRRLTLELPELDGLRVHLAVRAGRVHVEVDPPAHLDQTWRDLRQDLSASLARRGFDLAGSAADGRAAQQRSQEQQRPGADPASTGPSVQARRQRDASELRL